MNRKAILLGFAAIGLAGCHTDMWREPKIEPYAASSGELFTDGGTARPLLPGTIARDHVREDSGYFTGMENGKWVSTIPSGISKDMKALLLRGQDRFKAYCTPCHGQLGDGEGMIARRGFELRRPVGNYHTDRLRKMPIGHFYDVITNGYGAMYSYASRIEPQDRWAVAAYIRVLQLSQDAAPEDVDQAALTAQKAQEAKDKAPKTEGGSE